MDLYLYVIILYLTNVSAGTVQKIDILNSQPAIKGTSVKLACYVSQFSSQDLVSIYKTDSEVLTGSLPPALTQCIPSTCLTTTVGRYTFSADTGHVYIDITNLHRSEDQKWWTCVLDTQRKDMHLNIYTVPQNLQLVSPPNQDQDLAENAVTLRCSTDCTYPQPSFKWYDNETGGSLTEWSTSGTDSDTTGGCTDSERIYTSTLSLARYSTFPGNLDKTVKFTCGIPTFTGMTQPLYTNPSVDIKFACHDNTQTDNTEVIVGAALGVFSFALIVYATVITVLWKKKSSNKVDPCQNNPCVHGTCISHQSEFLCKCQSGYTGERCDKTDDQSPYSRQCILEKHGFCTCLTEVFLKNIPCDFNCLW